MSSEGDRERGESEQRTTHPELILLQAYAKGQRSHKQALSCIKGNQVALFRYTVLLHAAGHRNRLTLPMLTQQISWALTNPRFHPSLLSYSCKTEKQTGQFQSCYKDCRQLLMARQRGWLGFSCNSITWAKHDLNCSTVLVFFGETLQGARQWRSYTLPLPFHLQHYTP